MVGALPAVMRFEGWTGWQETESSKDCLKIVEASHYYPFPQSCNSLNMSLVALQMTRTVMFIATTIEAASIFGAVHTSHQSESFGVHGPGMRVLTSSDIGKFGTLYPAHTVRGSVTVPFNAQETIATMM